VSRWARRRAAAYKGEKICHTAMLGDLAVAHSHDVDGFKVDSSTGRRPPKECSLVRSMIRLVSRHKLSVGGLPMDICVEIRECSTKPAV
jgi:hypothetical protein